MKKILNLLLIIVAMSVLSTLCFSATTPKISRQKALKLVASAMRAYPCISYFYSMECPNCHKLTAENGCYLITPPVDIVFSFLRCTYCNYLEAGYAGDPQTNPGGTLYKGTK